MDIRTRFENCNGRVGFVAEYPVKPSSAWSTPSTMLQRMGALLPNASNVGRTIRLELIPICAV
jgi:hypothetical protein